MQESESVEVETVKKPKRKVGRPTGEQAGTALKRERLLKALQKNMGLVTYAARAANVSPWFYYEQYKNNPEFKRAVDEIQDNRLDMAEAMLLRKIQEGNDTCLIFYLKTKGKNRGYIERVENINTDMVIHVIRRD